MGGTDNLTNADNSQFGRSNVVDIPLKSSSAPAR
jgi:hypothetical protein